MQLIVELVNPYAPGNMQYYRGNKPAFKMAPYNFKFITAPDDTDWSVRFEILNQTSAIKSLGKRVIYHNFYVNNDT